MLSEPELAVDVTEAEANATFRKVAWRIIPLLVFCYILAFIDRANVGFAKLEFAKDLGFSEAVYGLGGGLFYLGYSLFEVPSNLLLAKVGVRITLLRIMVLWSLFSSALAFMTAPSHYYTLRTLLGAAEAGFFPGILFYLTTWIPSSRRGRFTALFMSSIAISGLIGGPISGLVMHSMDGLWGLRGWQWLFLVEGVPSAVMGVVAYRVLSDSPEKAAWLDDRQKAIIIRELRAETAAKQGKSHAAFGAALRDPRFYALVGMSIGLIAGLAGVFLWVPTVIRQSGVTNLTHVGLISALPFAVGIAAQQLIARHSDQKQERRWHAAIPVLVAALGWALLPQFKSDPVISFVLITMVTAGSLGATGPFWTMPALYLSGAAAAGGIALITTVGGIGAFFSPAIVGWLTTATGSLAFGLYYYAFILAGGALIMLAGTRPSAVPAPLATVAR